MASAVLLLLPPTQLDSDPAAAVRASSRILSQEGVKNYLGAFAPLRDLDHPRPPPPPRLDAAPPHRLDRWAELSPSLLERPSH